MRKQLFMSVCLAMLAITGNVLALDFTWIGPNGGDWSTVANWWDKTNDAPATRLPGYPENGDWAVIESGVGIGPALNVWEHNTYGILTRNGDITVKNGAYIGCRKQFYVAYDPGDVSTVTVEPGGTLTMAWDANWPTGSYIGNQGTGTLNNSGLVYSKKYVFIGTEVGSTGVVNMYPGSEWQWMTDGQKLCYVGTHGNGTLNMYGGFIDAGGTRLDITNYAQYVAGDPNTSTGHIEMVDGLIKAKHLYMEVNAQTLALNGAGNEDIRGTIHQTGGEFWFDDANQELALNRVNQAIDLGWWTTDPGMQLVVDQLADGIHVTVIPEPAAIVLLGLGSLVILRRRR